MGSALKNKYVSIFIILFVTGCASGPHNPAPVFDGIMLDNGNYSEEVYSKPDGPVIGGHNKAEVVDLHHDAPVNTPKAEDWNWPADGPVVKKFLEEKTSKGIDISGSIGAPVFASRGGKVVYSGSGLPGYGKLVLIKNDSRWITAYGYNQKLLVREGDWVRAGHKIAEMGNDSNGNPRLHFEVRKDGKPINPLKVLHGGKGRVGR